MLGSIKSFVLRNYLVIILIVLFFIIYSIHSIARHLTLQTQAFDMGIYSQTFWLWHSGEQPFSTLNKNHIFANHFEPALLLLLPIYNLFPSSITLLMIQALFVSLSALPIYLLCIRKLSSRISALVLTLTYLSSIGILYAVSYDFHTSTLALLPLGWVVYFIASEKHFLALFFNLTALTFKEDSIYFLFVISIYLLLQKKIKPGLSFLGAAILGYFFIYNIFSPQFVITINEHTITSLRNNLNITELMSSPLISLNKLTNPLEKLQLPLLIYGEYLFLSFSNLLSTLITIPHILVRLVSEKPAHWEVYWHYNANIQPFLIFGVIHFFNRIQKAYSYIRNIILTILSVFATIKIIFIILIPTFSNTSYISAYLQSRSLLNQIPSTNIVSADPYLVPQLSYRKFIYLCPEINNAKYIVTDKRVESLCVFDTNLYKQSASTDIIEIWELSNK